MRRPTLYKTIRVKQIAPGFSMSTSADDLMIGITYLSGDFTGTLHLLALANGVNIKDLNNYELVQDPDVSGPLVLENSPTTITNFYKRSGFPEGNYYYALCDADKVYMRTNLYLFTAGENKPPEAVSEASAYSISPLSETYQAAVFISWVASPNATNYILAAVPNEALPITQSMFIENGQDEGGNYNAVYQFNFPVGDSNVYLQFTITAINAFGESEPFTVTSEDTACFPKNTQVPVVDGYKNIQDIKVGDLVIGAYGERNTVIGLQKVLVSNNKMFKINGTHITSDHHPHLGFDRKFYVVEDPEKTSAYKRKHLIYNGTKYVEKHLEGLSKERLHIFQIGQKLRSVTGSTELKTIEPIELPKGDWLYNLVVDGSHTYFADGYAVTGWPNENDFNYDTWKHRV
jgi:hypothetical protein